MGHRLTTGLIFLNAMGFFACVVLIAAYGNQTPDAAIHFIRSIQSSIRLFIVGAGLPLAAWEIAAADPLAAWEIAAAEFIGLMSNLVSLSPAQRIFCCLFRGNCFSPLPGGYRR